MSTFANSEEPDEMQHNAAFHQGLHCKGKNLQTKEYNIFLKIITRHPQISTMDYPKFIVSNQREESISIRSVKEGFYSNAIGTKIS